ncbi:unnamed protein product, partial [Arabidopsis halleri]
MNTLQSTFHPPDPPDPPNIPYSSSSLVLLNIVWIVIVDSFSTCLVEDPSPIKVHTSFSFHRSRSVREESRRRIHFHRNGDLPPLVGLVSASFSRCLFSGKVLLTRSPNLAVSYFLTHTTHGCASW